MSLAYFRVTNRSSAPCGPYQEFLAYGDEITRVKLTTRFGVDFHGVTYELTLRIVIEQPPSGVDFALQKGRGNTYETVQKQRSEGKDLAFEFQPLIREGASDSMAALGGPFVQGPPAAALRSCGPWVASHPRVVIKGAGNPIARPRSGRVD